MSTTHSIQPSDTRTHGAPRRTMTMRRGLLALLVALVAAVAGAGSASAAPTSVYVSGAVGPWLWSDPWHQCYESLRAVDTMRVQVGRTSQYPNSTQGIYMIPRVDITSDGSHWTNGYRWGSWSYANVAPGGTVTFPYQRLSTAPTGYGARVVFYFRWYVGSSLVGEVHDMFTQSDYAGHTFSNGGFNAGCY